MTELTFAQQHGFAPLPSQSASGTISQQTKSIVWAIIADWIEPGPNRNRLSDDASGTMYRWWVFHKERMVDEAPGDHQVSRWKDVLKSEIQSSFPSPYNLVQFLIRDPGFDKNALIAEALEFTRAAYRVVDGALIQYSSDEEIEQAQKAFDAIAASGCTSAREHMEAAASELTAGNWRGSAHESVSAVEAAARKAVGNKKLDLAACIKQLRGKGRLAHGTIGEMVLKLYGYASDEAGVRHSLTDDSESKVGEAEAMMVFGVSASLVTYLLSLD